LGKGSREIHDRSREVNNRANEIAGITRWALRAGAIVPLAYCTVCVIAACYYPGFNFVAQPVSELGSLVALDQAHPWIFNGGVIATAAAVMLGSIGIFAAHRRSGGHVGMGVLVALAMMLVALSTAIVGLVPWPDQRHGGPDPFGGPGWLASAFLLTPLLLAIAWWKRGDSLLRGCLAGGVLLTVALTVVRSGTTGIVRGGPYEGLVQLLFAVAAYGPIGICSVWQLSAASGRSRRAIARSAAAAIVLVTGASLARGRLAMRTFDVRQPVAGGVADVSAALDTIRARTGVPALAVAVIGPRGLIAVGASGVRKLGDTARVSISDRWRLWSDTKAMTAMLIGMYVDAGTLSWDATLPTLFPSVEHMDPGFSTVTLAQLLEHRSGIGEDPVLPPNAEYRYDYPGAREVLADFTRTPQANRAELARLALEHAPHYAPGSQFQYSNWNYIIASSILERMSGSSWEELVSTRLFAPLGMKNCGFGVPASHGEPTEPWDHLGSIPIAPGIHQAPQSDITPTYGPSSTVVCTLEDWGKFLALFLRDGRHDIVSPATLSRITTAASSNGYAMGWFNGPQRGFGGTVLYHTGTNNQSMATALIDHSRSRAYVAAVNTFVPGTFDIAAATLARLQRAFVGR
jgi:D-alanyl-D-alanine carboxypeptidase